MPPAPPSTGPDQPEPPARLRLNLIGCGRVGLTLARLWHQAQQVEIVGLHSRSRSSAEAAHNFIGAGQVVNHLESLPPADLWLITTPDTALETVATQLGAAQVAGNPPDRQPRIALHCSGFLSSQVLHALSAQGWAVASAHPVRSFADPAQAVQAFPGTPLGLEGDPRACNTLRPLFEAVGARCFDLSVQAKPLYHAAAVFANNFTTVLQGIAQDLWQHCGLPPDMARELDLALLGNTLANLQTQTPAQALTGPAARGDHAVVQMQGAAVGQWHPQAGQLYAELSDMAARLKQTGRV